VGDSNCWQRRKGGSRLCGNYCALRLVCKAIIVLWLSLEEHRRVIDSKPRALQCPRFTPRGGRKAATPAQSNSLSPTARRYVVPPGAPPGGGYMPGVGYIPAGVPVGSVIVETPAPKAVCDAIIAAHPQLANSPQGCNFISTFYPAPPPSTSPMPPPPGAVITPAPSGVPAGPTAGAASSCTSWSNGYHKRRFDQPLQSGFSEAAAGFQWNRCSVWTQWVDCSYNETGSTYSEKWCGTWGNGGHNYLNALSYGNDWNVYVNAGGGTIKSYSCYQRWNVNIYGNQWDGGANCEGY
jgi:hypothetical protein